MTLQELRNDLLQEKPIRHKGWLEELALKWSFTSGWMFSSNKGVTWAETTQQPTPLNMFDDGWELTV